MTTVEPGSAVTSIGVFVFALPVRSVSITGASGAVVSVAGFTSLGVDLFPDASVAVTVTSPTGMFSVGVIVTFPSAPAVPRPISFPPAVMTTVEPGSAVTSIGVLVFALPVRSVSITGFSGAVASLVVIVTGTLTFSLLPSPYVTSTSTFVGPPTSVGIVPLTSLFVIVLPAGASIALVTSSAVGLC